MSYVERSFMHNTVYTIPVYFPEYDYDENKYTFQKSISFVNFCFPKIIHIMVSNHTIKDCIQITTNILSWKNPRT